MLLLLYPSTTCTLRYTTLHCTAHCTALHRPCYSYSILSIHPTLQRLTQCTTTPPAALYSAINADTASKCTLKSWFCCHLKKWLWGIIKASVHTFAISHGCIPIRYAIKVNSSSGLPKTNLLAWFGRVYALLSAVKLYDDDEDLLNFKMVEAMQIVVVKQALFDVWRLFVGSGIWVKWCLITGYYYRGGG